MAVTVASGGAFFRSGSAADRGVGVLPSEAARRNATRSARARASGRPAKLMKFPGTAFSGFVIHASRARSFHTMPDFLSAREYLPKDSSEPALRPHTPARLGPVMLRPGSREWHAAHAWNARAPRAVSPAFCAAAAAANAKARAGAAYRVIILVCRLRAPRTARWRT